MQSDTTTHTTTQENGTQDLATVEKKIDRELDERIDEIGYKSLEETAKQTAAALKLPYLNLKTYPIDPRALLLISEEDARRGELVAVRKEGNMVTVAVYNSSKKETLETLSTLNKKGFTYVITVVSRNSLIYAWTRYALHRPKQEVDAGVIDLQEAEIQSIQNQIKDLGSLKENIEKLPITSVLDIIVAGALKLGASDIHLEPEKTTLRMRYRLDGVLSDMVTLPMKNYPRILSRIKLHSGIKMNVHNIPQDGRFKIKTVVKEVEVRVATLPGPRGESVVMRILDPETIRKKLEDLGMRSDELNLVKRVIKKTTGVFLATGPTGSGKTTTLYAFLRHINTPEIKVVTLEDPIEYRIPGIVQTQVDVTAGYTFADGLRSIVRQDPDIILVGEIRDYETAEMALQAALTGHLVLSTIHANSAAGVIPRLIDLGVETVTIAPAVNATMAQRLVRTLCIYCRKKEKIHPDDLALIKRYLAILPEHISIPKLDPSLEIYYPRQCIACNATGYRGRIGVFEVFEVDDEMERIIIQSPLVSVIENLAKKKGMITLLQDGLMKALSGTTSIAEVMRVIGE